MKKDNIKIGVFIDTYFPMIDGVVIVADNYAKNLVKKGDDVFIAASCSKKSKSISDYRLLRCNRIKLKSRNYGLPLPKIDFRFKKELKKENPDIIHIHSPFCMGKTGISFAKKHNIPVIATLHTQFDQDIYKITKSKIITKIMVKKMAKTFNKCDELFVMSELLKEKLREYGYKGKTRIIPNATDMQYPKDPQKLLDFINKKHNLKTDETVFLFVGRIVAEKGVLFLLDVLKKLKDKGQKFKMIYVGSGASEKDAKEKTKELGLEENVIFAGRITDREELSAYYLRANLFLFPSRYDTDSLVQKEAGANKTATLFCDGAITAHAITDNDTGFFAPYEENAYTEKLYKIINDKKLLDKVSKNVYDKMHVTWEQVVEKVREGYKEVIERKKTRTKK